MPNTSVVVSCTCKLMGSRYKGAQNGWETVKCRAKIEMSEFAERLHGHAYC